MRLIVPTLAALTIITSTSVVFAQTPSNVVVTGSGDSITGRAEQRREEAAATGRRQTATPVSSSPKVPAIAPEVRWDPVLQDACLHVGRRMADPADAAAVLAEVNAYDFAPILDPCTATGSQPLPAVPSPAAAAQMVWRDQVRLPSPEPYIAPGKGITGLAAFLEVRGPRAVTQSFNVFGYALTITAAMTSYDIDWGDGTWSRGVTSSGGPWPNGDVRHVYTIAKNYRVRVFQNWTGTWSMAGGGGGVVDGTLQTEGRIEAFPVDQLQAVRNR